MKKETGSVSTVVEFVQDSGTAAFACGADGNDLHCLRASQESQRKSFCAACLLVPSRPGRVVVHRTLGVLVWYASVGG